LSAVTPWWRSAVIYEVYIRSFADGDGDGVGDIAGLRSRLAYLAELGVDALWITPWYPSPMRDGGYDVSDLLGIEPVFGTLDQAGTLGFTREPGFACIVNFWSESVEPPADAEVLIASGPLEDDGRVPADTAVWFAV
jgi:hypothetical protein